ncbi:unnamed protein product [Linum tenue]|uniref:DDB1- and CUL4-associated factor 8 n=1 Tax=Linum tenue TaxID=586396 RepID=A0AAV0QMW7_9ROSI|nr:unnamed protein product [Linum tenue]
MEMEVDTPRKRIRVGFDEIRRREVGFSSPTFFRRYFSGSEVLVKQINLQGKLAGHDGCVNAIQFNSTGDILVSGSDDRQVVFWDWTTQKKKLSYDSGHLDNIFQTKIMPLTDDRIIVTSSADGQVRLGQVKEHGKVFTKKLGKHQGRVHNLAVEPGSPHVLYSCGEDGIVQHFDLRTHSCTRLFCCSSLADNDIQHSKKIRLNSIVIDPRNPNYFGVGGSDEYARVYDIRKCQWSSNDDSTPLDTFCPRHLIKSNEVHITALAYSSSSELLVSYNDELIYLFQKDMGMGPDPCSVSPIQTQKLGEPQVYTGHRNSQTVKGVSFFGPSDEYVATGSDCGHIFIWEKKDARLVRVMFGDRRVVNQIEPHPHVAMFASCGIEKTVKLWCPSPSESPPLPDNIEKIMESNKQGREDHSRVYLSPDVIMRILRLQRNQAVAYIESRFDRADFQDSDDDDNEGRDAYVMAFSEGEEGSSSEDPRDCNIS